MDTATIERLIEDLRADESEDRAIRASVFNLRREIRGGAVGHTTASWNAKVGRILMQVGWLLDKLEERFPDQPSDPWSCS